MNTKTGRIFVVATPIGNLEDISRRALDVLGTVDRILAEDTRHSAKLLARYGLSVKVNAFHEHNEREVAASVIERVRAGENIALISDAGTPLISDPGYFLIRLAHENNVTVVPVPGPSAVMAALSVSGVPTDRFYFEGFLPSRSAQRRKRLQALATATHTIILLESPRRVLGTLSDMMDVFGRERHAAVAKELTKIFETVRADSLEALHGWLAETPERRKGEFVIVVSGAAPRTPAAEEHRVLLEALLEELPLKTAVNLATRISGTHRNSLYELALRLSQARD